MAGVASEIVSTAPASEVRAGLSSVPQARPAPELSVIVPTSNARDKVPALVATLSRILAAHDWEVLFVDDDFADGTAALARSIGETDSRVRCLRRIGRRGRAGAALEGLLASQARYLAVLDLDFAGDEDSLVAMLQRLRAGRADLVSIAGDGLTGDWPKRFVQRVLRCGLADPMSGSFMIRRDAFEALAPAVSPEGTSVLLDLLFAARGRLRADELPRGGAAGGRHGSDAAAVLELANLFVARASYGTISIRFLMFCLVGLSGVAIHLAILRVGLVSAGLPFAAAQAAAAIGAMAWNFTLNNVFTYRDRKLTGRAFIGGLIRFQVICAIGAVSNVGVASFIYSGGHNWWLAGLGGVLMGAVWNYAVTSVFVWRKK